MFEKYRARKGEERAAEQARHAEDASAAALAEWQEQHDFFQQALDLARTYHGELSDDLVCKAGETVFASVGGASLVEDRAGRGHWEGRSQGVSIPIGSLGGRSVRYRVGASKGHYVQDAPVPTAIDTGTLFVTNRRVVFRGAKQNRECLFDKLLGVEHHAGESSFAVSNRQKNTVVHYGSELDAWFRLRYALAFSDYQGTRDALVAELTDHVAEIDRTKPTPPAAVPAPATTASPPPLASPLPPPPAPDMHGHPAAWAKDPTGRHEYRWWDGTAWTAQVSDQGVVGSDPPD